MCRTAQGALVTQSTAMYNFLGRRLGLMGSNEAELQRVDQTLAQAFDLRNDTMALVYPFKGD